MKPFLISYFDLLQMLRRIITQDKENKEIDGAILFSTCLVNILDSDSIEAYLGCNRGCFVLVTNTKQWFYY